MARWRNEPHVRAWWEMDDDPVPYTLEDAHEEYEPDLEPDAKTTAAIILLRDRPVGYVQWYRWDDFGEAAEMGVPDDGDAFGLDIFIGEPDVVDTGVGSATVDLVCRTLFTQRNASCVALLTAVGNEQAQHAYEKAGLRKAQRVLDTDIKDGERVDSWLMIRGRADVTRSLRTGRGRWTRDHWVLVCWAIAFVVWVAGSVWLLHAISTSTK